MCIRLMQGARGLTPDSVWTPFLKHSGQAPARLGRTLPQRAGEGRTAPLSGVLGVVLAPGVVAGNPSLYTGHGVMHPRTPSCCCPA